VALAVEFRGRLTTGTHILDCLGDDTLRPETAGDGLNSQFDCNRGWSWTSSAALIMATLIELK
jgi:hypothetical protein